MVFTSIKIIKFVRINTDLVRKIIVVEAVNHDASGKFSKIQIFTQNSDVIIGNNYCQLFALKNRLTSFTFEQTKYLPDTGIWITIFCWWSF